MEWIFFPNNFTQTYVSVLSLLPQISDFLIPFFVPLPGFHSSLLHPSLSILVPIFVLLLPSTHFHPYPFVSPMIFLHPLPRLLYRAIHGLLDLGQCPFFFSEVHYPHPCPFLSLKTSSSSFLSCLLSSPSPLPTPLLSHPFPLQFPPLPVSLPPPSRLSRAPLSPMI